MRAARKRMRGLPCAYPGCTTPADTVDHIVPYAIDPTRWDDPTNMRPMCRSHNAKLGGQIATARKARARLAQVGAINRRRRRQKTVVTRNQDW